MGRFFLPRQWRMPKLVLGLLLFEFPWTVANLTLFGIAAPNTYRTILWRTGGKMGFNSDPDQVAYAAYNYKEMSTPVVWSSLNTNYNMYIGVVCMFFYLIKFTLYLLHIFYPILSLLLHLALAGLWCASLYFQTAPDTVDPAHQNKGAPWYITKNCNIVDDKIIRGYCMQAKSAFAVSVIMLATYTAFLVLTCYSLIPTAPERLKRDTKLAEKKAEKELYASSPYDDAASPEAQWQHMWELQQLPRTPGTATGNPPWARTPATPRTRAFNELQGGGGGMDGHGGMQEYYTQQYQPTPQHTYSPPPPQPYSPSYPPPPPQQQQQQQTYYPPPAQHDVSYAGVAPHGQRELDDEYIYDGKGKGTAM